MGIFDRVGFTSNSHKTRELLLVKASTTKMKCFVLMSALLACTLAVPVSFDDDDVCLQHMDQALCEALKPIDLEVADEQSKRQMPPPPDGGFPGGDGGVPGGDEMIEQLIMMKLKAFEWLTGVLGPEVQGFVRSFIDGNRDLVVGAIKTGGFAVIKLVTQLVGGILAGGLGR